MSKAKAVLPMNARENNTTSKNSTQYIKFNQMIYEKIELVVCANETHIDNSSSSSSASASNSSTQYGFVIAGYCPCHVENVAQNSLADRVGLRKGDLIIKVNEVNCCRARIKSILSLIKSTHSNNNNNNTLKLLVYRSTQTTKHLQMKIGKIVNENQKPPSSRNAKLGFKSRIVQKLFKPSMAWLTCAISRPQHSNTTHSTSNTLEQTYYTKTSDLLVEQNDVYVLCTKECCTNKSIQKIKSIVSSSDTGYETLSRYDSATTRSQSTQPTTDSGDFTIDTITNTTNSYSQCDLTVEPTTKSNVNRRASISKHNHFNQECEEQRTILIGNLIELEANFVEYLSMAVSTFSHPLRGFFMKQCDYFTLFQNIEKILIISENFLRSMHKWSAYELYTKIGQLYAHKIALFKEAFTIYAQGYSKAKHLYEELHAQSKKFRLFLNEVQSHNMTLSNMLDLPIVHIQKTLQLFKQIRKCTQESRRNPSEAPHADSVIFELRKILSQLNTNDIVNLKLDYAQKSFSSQDQHEEDECRDEECLDEESDITEITQEEEEEEEDETSDSFNFMNENGSIISTIVEVEEDYVATEEFIQTTCKSSVCSDDYLEHNVLDFSSIQNDDKSIYQSFC